MSKEIKAKSRLDLNNVPTPKKEDASKKGKLGLITRKKALQPIAFRMRPEVIKVLEDLVVKLQRKSRVRITKVSVLELCILHAHDKSLEELINFYNENIV